MESARPSVFDSLLPETPDARRRLGTAMIGVAVVGVIVAVVGTIVAWQFVGDVNAASRRSLDATIDTLDTVDDSIDLADSVLTATTDTLDTASSTLTAVSSSFDEATGVIDEIATLTETVGPALDDTASTLRKLEGVGSGIDNVLESLDNLPLSPNYDSENGLGTTIGDLAADIEPLPAQFTTTSEQLDGFGTSIDDLTSDVQALSTDIDAVVTELDGTGALIRAYRANVADARSVAVTARDDLTGGVGWTRILLVIGGMNLAAAQIVPLWLGRTLRRSPRHAWPDPSSDAA